MKGTEQYFPVVLFIIVNTLSQVVSFFIRWMEPSCLFSLYVAQSNTERITVNHIERLV